MLKETGEVIKYLTQEELATKLWVNISSVQKYEDRNN